eukprot:Opistho-2@94008
MECPPGRHGRPATGGKHPVVRHSDAVARTDRTVAGGARDRNQSWRWSFACLAVGRQASAMICYCTRFGVSAPSRRGIDMDNIESLLRAADEARSRGDRTQEAALMDRALVIAANSPQLLNSRGMLALTLERPDDAAYFFARAADADPRQPALWMNLATARRASGDEPGEKAALDHVLELDQVHFMAQLRTAEWLERNGQLAQATKNWSQVLALADGLKDQPAALRDRLDEARRFVRTRMADFADEVDGHFKADFVGAPPPDVRRFQASIDHLLGRRRIYRNECSGMHYPFLPADEFFRSRAFSLDRGTGGQDRCHSGRIAQPVEARAGPAAALCSAGRRNAG